MRRFWSVATDLLLLIALAWLLPLAILIVSVPIAALFRLIEAAWRAVMG